MHTRRLILTFIGIYPEWNVKLNVTQWLDMLTDIGIYPEWNVKYRR